MFRDLWEQVSQRLRNQSANTNRTRFFFSLPLKIENPLQRSWNTKEKSLGIASSRRPHLVWSALGFGTKCHLRVHAQWNTEITHMSKAAASIETRLFFSGPSRRISRASIVSVLMRIFFMGKKPTKSKLAHTWAKAPSQHRTRLLLWCVFLNPNRAARFTCFDNHTKTPALLQNNHPFAAAIVQRGRVSNEASNAVTPLHQKTAYKKHLNVALQKQLSSAVQQML